MQCFIYFLHIHLYYHQIGTLAQELACLEYWCGLPQTKDFLNIKIPNSFMEFACVKLKLALEGLFNPIFSHTQSLGEYNIAYY